MLFVIIYILGQKNWDFLDEQYNCNTNWWSFTWFLQIPFVRHNFSVSRLWEYKYFLTQGELSIEQIRNYNLRNTKIDFSLKSQLGDNNLSQNTHFMYKSLNIPVSIGISTFAHMINGNEIPFIYLDVNGNKQSKSYIQFYSLSKLWMNNQQKIPYHARGFLNAITFLFFDIKNSSF